MSSELYLYSTYLFSDPRIMNYILTSFSYSLLKNKKFKKMIWIGYENKIKDFLNLLKDTSFFKNSFYQNERYIHLNKNIRIILEDEYLTNFKYLTNNQSVINFTKEESIISLDRNKILDELEISITNYINYLISKRIPGVLYEDLVSGEKYLSRLYQGYFVNNFDKTTFDIFDIHNSICEWCNKDFSINQIKEYLILLFGKPEEYNKWKLE